MTRTYELAASSLEIAHQFGADAGPDPWAGGVVEVGQFAPVIIRSGRTGRKVIRPMHWGYPPPDGMPMPGDAPPRWVPNVRNLESPFWIGNLRHTELRCLVPVTCFPAASHWFSVTDRSIFAFAGIWRDLTDMPVFAVLTTEPNAMLRSVKAQAMPVILHREDHDAWLGNEWKEAQELAVQFPGQYMQVR